MSFNKSRKRCRIDARSIQSEGPELEKHPKLRIVSARLSHPSKCMILPPLNVHFNSIHTRQIFAKGIYCDDIYLLDVAIARNAKVVVNVSLSGDGKRHAAHRITNRHPHSLDVEAVLYSIFQMEKVRQPWLETVNPPLMAYHVGYHARVISYIGTDIQNGHARPDAVAQPTTDFSVRNALDKKIEPSVAGVVDMIESVINSGC